MDQHHRYENFEDEFTLSVNITNTRFKNPLILASGVLGMTGSLLRRAVREGAGGIVAKTVSLDPRDGYDNPVIVGVEGGFLNAVGTPNPGYLNIEEELREAKKEKAPVIASAMAPDPEGFGRIALALESYGADIIELNVSCPHVYLMGAQVGQDYILLKEVVREVKSKVSIPVWVKLTPNVTNIVEEGKAAEDGGADALVAINTIKAMTINIDSQKPILSNRFGGLSGPAIRSVAVRCVYELYENTKIPIIGVGGITDWRSATEFLLAGARGIQIGSAIAYKGLRVFKEVNEGLRSYLNSKGFKSIEDCIGIAHKR
jgi:dihydroorotate dehydrogenase (NAD+) catalytic subunit